MNPIAVPLKEFPNECNFIYELLGLKETFAKRVYPSKRKIIETKLGSESSA